MSQIQLDSTLAFFFIWRKKNVKTNPWLLSHWKNRKTTTTLPLPLPTLVSQQVWHNPSEPLGDKKVSFGPISRHLLFAVRYIALLGECESAVDPAGGGLKFWILFNRTCLFTAIFCSAKMATFALDLFLNAALDFSSGPLWFKTLWLLG